MSIVKVEVKKDNEGDICYVVGHRYYGEVARTHYEATAFKYASKVFSSMSLDYIERLGLIDVPIIHTYEIEVDS